MGDLEKLLEGPTVSKAVGQNVVNIISNLMGGNTLALSASANRCNSHYPQPTWTNSDIYLKCLVFRIQADSPGRRSGH